MIIGAGFAGLAAAIALDRAGIHDFVILESSGSVGGTWRDNTYPGAACDIPSQLYSLSFAPNPDWSRKYATQREILRYLEGVAGSHNLMSRARFGARVTEANWREDRWVIQADQEYQATFLIHGIGALRDPKWPDLPNLQSFSGDMIHSARWPQGLDLTGKRVGVVGTGASAIQVIPAIAPLVDELHVFQRTPPWVRPRNDAPVSARKRRIYRLFPAVQKLSRAAVYTKLEAHHPLIFGNLHRHTRFIDRLLAADLRRRIPKELAKQVTPTIRLGCKRVLLSDDYYPALAQPNVHLHSTLTGVESKGVTTDTSGSIPLDALICCTGFTVDNPLGSLKITGRTNAHLHTLWQERPAAYLGITVPEFPNQFVLLGPNTALGHNSVVVMIEAAVRYVVQAIQYALPRGPIEVTKVAMETFLNEVDTAHKRQVWTSGCESWYLNKSGINFTIWPGTASSYILRTWSFDPENYNVLQSRT